MIVMKRLFCIFILVLFSANIYSQQLDGFKYVHVNSLKYTDGRHDIWGIRAKVMNAFIEKGFIYLTSEIHDKIYNSEYILSVLIVDIKHTNVDGENTVAITLEDYDGRPVMSMSGSGIGFSQQSSYNKATKKALSHLRSMSYTFNPLKMPKDDLPEIEKSSHTEESLRAYYDKQAKHLNPLEGIYKYNPKGKYEQGYRLGIYKDGYKYKAVVIEAEDYRWDTGEIKAEFELANNVYSVMWRASNKVNTGGTGYWNSNGQLEIQISKAQAPIELVKIYPLNKGNEQVPSDDGIVENTPKGLGELIATGTGFAISRNGFIATNAHVVKGASRIKVDMFSGKDGSVSQYDAEVVVVDPINDVAIIRITDLNYRNLKSLPYSIETRANVGAEVYTIGYPLSSIMGSNYKVSNGIISSNSGINDDIRLYQMTVPIQPGNSGGPLLNKNGNIVGITSAGLNGEAINTHVENVFYAIKSLYLLNAIYSIPDIEDMPNESIVKGMTLEEQINVIKDYIYLIKVY